MVTPEFTFGVAMSPDDVSLVLDLSALPALANWDVRAEAFVATGVALSGPNDVDVPRRPRIPARAAPGWPSSGQKHRLADSPIPPRMPRHIEGGGRADGVALTSTPPTRVWGARHSGLGLWAWTAGQRANRLMLLSP